MKCQPVSQHQTSSLNRFLLRIFGQRLAVVVEGARCRLACANARASALTQGYEAALQGADQQRHVISTRYEQFPVLYQEEEEEAEEEDK